MENRGAKGALGSRVALLGSRIERRWYRHYLGRVFATAASLILRLPVYDTQCGAKLFRNTEALRAALGRPFFTRWAFDVELLNRMLRESDAPLGVDDLIEIPLREWRDKAGSRMGVPQMLRGGLELLTLAARSASVRWRRPHGRIERNADR
jgi:hypothetical protein